MKRQPKKTGRRFLAGSSITVEQPAKPVQEPILPTKQLEPSRGDVAAARRNLLPTDTTDKVMRSTRERHGYSRADIAAMLRTKNVSAALEPWQVAVYLRLADRNATLAEIGARYGGGEIGARVMVADWERLVILKYQFLNGRLPVASAKNQEPVERDNFDRSVNESKAAQNVELDGGEHMVTVTGQGYVQNSKGLHARPLDTFDGGQTFVRGASDDVGVEYHDESVGHMHDDYGEDSGA